MIKFKENNSEKILEQLLNEAEELIGKHYNRWDEKHKLLVRKGLLNKKIMDRNNHLKILGKGPVRLMLELYEKADVVYVIKCSGSKGTTPVESLLSKYEIAHFKHLSFLITEPFNHRSMNLFGRKYSISKYGGIKKSDLIEELNKQYDDIEEVLNSFLKNFR